MYLLLYVDDMLVATLNMADIKKVKDQLNSEFEIKDFGTAKRILNIEIIRDRPNRKLQLPLKSFTEKVLGRFDMKKAKPVSTPLAAHFRLSAALCPKNR